MREAPPSCACLIKTRKPLLRPDWHPVAGYMVMSWADGWGIIRQLRTAFLCHCYSSLVSPLIHLLLISHRSRKCPLLFKVNPEPTHCPPSLPPPLTQPCPPLPEPRPPPCCPPATPDPTSQNSPTPPTRRLPERAPQHPSRQLAVPVRDTGSGGAGVHQADVAGGCESARACVCTQARARARARRTSARRPG